MKNSNYFLACSTLFVTTFASMPLQGAIQIIDETDFVQATCPCQNKKRPVRPVPGAEEAISFAPACGDCRGRDRKLVKYDDAIDFTLAGGCGCQQKRPPVPRPPRDVQDDVGFVTTAAGPRKNRPDNSDVTFLPVAFGQQDINNERVQKRPMPPKREAELYGEIAKIAAKNKKFIAGKNAPKSAKQLNIQERGWNIFGSSTTYPPISHYVRETDAQGSIVTIQDGSVWSVKESDQDTVKNWSVHTELTIMPNNLSFWNKLTGTKPAHKFRLVNLQNNQEVAANMSLGPFKYNPNTRKIDRIDFSRGEVYLNNGTIWKVDTSRPCMQILRDWQKGHAMICGTNDTWFSLGSPFILISVEKENWLPATRVF